MTSRLLVADGSITIQKIVSMAFENEDMEVEGVDNGQEAFDRIAEFNPDIVLADVDMLGLDGFELSTKIKETSETSGIKVLLLASDFEGIDEQCYQTCRADNHISKPFKSDDIVSMVKSLLEGSSGDVDTSPAEGADSEAAEQTEEASEILSNLKVPEPQEKPSLEELLDSVEKLSPDEMGDLDLVDEGELLENATPPSEDEELQLPESMELSADDEALALSGEDLLEPMELSDFLDKPVASEEEKVPALNNDDDLMDQMIRGVEEIKESVQSPDPAEEEIEAIPFAEAGVDEPEIFTEVEKRRMENMDELDSAFKEIAKGGSPGPANHEEKPPALSLLGGIVPESEDFLEHIAPGAFSEVGKRPATPEDIKENLDAISGFSDQDPRNFPSRNWEYEASDDRFTQAIAEEVKQVLKRSLGTSLEKEVFGLSDMILKTICEVVERGHSGNYPQGDSGRDRKNQKAGHVLAGLA